MNTQPLLSTFVILSITTNANPIQLQTTYTNADNGPSSSTSSVVPTVNVSGNESNEGLPSPFLLLLPTSNTTTTKLNHRSSDQSAPHALTTITSFTNGSDHERKRRSRLRRQSNGVRPAVNGAAAALNDNDDLATAASYFFRPLFVYHIQESHRKKVVSERPQSAEK